MYTLLQYGLFSNYLANRLRLAVVYTSTMQLFKVIVHAEESNAEAVRQAIGNAGGGKSGNYIHCSFTHKGIGRSLPQEGANPTIGQIGTLEAIPEESIEVICGDDVLSEVIAAIKSVHSYDQPIIEVYKLDESSVF